MPRHEKELYEFGPFRLNVDERVLERIDGKKNGPLPDKAFQTLCILTRNSGHLVTKKELIEQVWPDSFVEENNLDKCIHTIRHALGEKHGKNKFIQTVPKHGYRFVADVRRPQAGEVIEHVPNNLAPQEYESPVRRIRRRYAFMLATLLLASAAAVLVYYFSSSNSTTSARKHVLVMPVIAIDSANRDDLLEIGLADSLILKLSSMSDIVVRPLSATRQYLDRGQDPIEAGREQNADYVLVSSFQISEQKLRVTGGLINVLTGQADDTFKVETEAADKFAMQDRVTAEIGKRFMQRFDSGAARQFKRGTGSEEAYRHYLQGMHFHSKRTRQGAEQAIREMNRAVELDPNYARAWAGKAHAHRAAANFGREVNIKEHHQRSLEAIALALHLDPDLSEAFSADCEIKMSYDWDSAAAEAACRKAIELDPNSSLAHQIFSRLLTGSGRHEEAIAEAQIAIDLDPGSVFNQRNYGNALHFARRHDDAVAQLKRTLAMEKDLLAAYRFLSNTLALSGHEEEAFEWYMKLLVQEKTDEATVLALRSAFAAESWKGVLRHRARTFEDGSEAYFHAAAYNAQIGETEKAFEYLEKSYRRREVWFFYLRVDPRLDSLHPDPRFEQFAARAGI